MREREGIKGWVNQGRNRSQNSQESKILLDIGPFRGKENHQHGQTAMIERQIIRQRHVGKNIPSINSQDLDQLRPIPKALVAFGLRISDGKVANHQQRSWQNEIPEPKFRWG